MNKFSVLFYILAILLQSCTAESQDKILTYQNIVILSDMSSRMNNKSSKDINEIQKIVQYFKNECVKPGQKIGDRSCISFSTFTNKIVASIDIGAIKNLGERQRFVNSTGEYSHTGLSKKIDDFQKVVRNSYASTRNPGLDLISILIEKIENEPIVKNDTHMTDGSNKTSIKYDNHIYIFTDGYLEYLNKKTNNQFYFGIAEINKVRQFCKNNNIEIKKALEMNSSLALPAVRNGKNRNISLHIFETHERDKNDQLQTYKYPRGQRDNEILEAVWRKWAKDSQFKSFEWRKY